MGPQVHREHLVSQVEMVHQGHLEMLVHLEGMAYKAPLVHQVKMAYQAHVQAAAIPTLVSETFISNFIYLGRCRETELPSVK